MPDDLVIGTIVAAAEHPGARAPSLLLTIDLGQHGTHDVVLPIGSHDTAELEGTQIVCRRETDGPLVIGAHSHGKGFILLRPEESVEPGTVVA